MSFSCLLCIERMINGIAFTKGLQEVFSPYIWDTNYNSKSWALLLSGCFLRVGKKYKILSANFPLWHFLWDDCSPAHTNRAQKPWGNLEVLGCHTSCSLPLPKQLAMEKHQEVICLGTAKWKSLIRSCRQHNENVETNLSYRR